MDPKAMSDSLRNWRGEHPVVDTALGFVPGVGQALDAQDMISDPSVLSAIGFLPFGGDALKALFKLRKAKKGVEAAKEAEKMIQVHKSRDRLAPRSLTQGDVMKAGVPEKPSMELYDDVYNVPESALKPHPTTEGLYHMADPSKAIHQESIIKPNPLSRGKSRGGPELKDRWSK
jgi:hypothetical protein